MPNYAVSASAKDETIGSGASTTGSGLLASIVNSLGTSSYGRAYINTSAIGTDIISAATFNWYHVSYTKTKTVAFNRQINISASSVLNDSGTPPSAGWHSLTLTSGQFALINKTGETEIEFRVADPGGVDFRTWTIQAWDFVPTGSRACYFAVTHAPAGGPTKFSILR